MEKVGSLAVLLVMLVGFLFVTDLVRGAIASIRKKPFESAIGKLVEDMTKTGFWIPIGIAVAYIYGFYVSSQF